MLFGVLFIPSVRQSVCSPVKQVSLGFCLVLFTVLFIPSDRQSVCSLVQQVSLGVCLVRNTDRAEFKKQILNAEFVRVVYRNGMLGQNEPNDA